jgi:hypothetical protein
MRAVMRAVMRAAMRLGPESLRAAATGLALAASLLASGCASLPEEGFAPVPRAEAPAFDPIAFFTGATQGHGELDKGVLGTVPIRVESFGVVAPNGTLVLVQDIHEGDKEPRTRTLQLRRTGENTYEGRFSDALGRVRAWTKGNMVTLKWRMEGNYEVTQILTLAPDGQRATNAMRVELLGAKVAVLWEEIERVE